MKRLIAEYFKSGSLKLVDISWLYDDGTKTMLLSTPVDGRKEAKEVSKQYNAKPQNF